VSKMGATGAPSMPMASPRPMPNPRLGGMGSSPIPPANPRLNPGQPAKPAGGGLFGNMPIQKRFDMAMDLLKNGMSMAANSGSPIAAFLAPLAGAAIGGGIENKRAKMMDAEGDELMASMLPGVDQEELQQLSDIVANPDAPDYLKTIAKAKLDAAIKPYMPGAAAKGGGGGGGSRKGGGGRKSGGGSGGKGKPKLYGEYEINGVLHGRTATGEMIPYSDPAGNPIPGKSGKTPAAPAPAAGGPVVIDGYTIEEIK
jgi:hypothetical protein